MTNPSTEAREAAASILRQLYEYAYEPNDEERPQLSDELTSIIQAAIEAHEKPMREWILAAPHFENCPALGRFDDEYARTYCNCGLGGLRSSLHHED